MFWLTICEYFSVNVKHISLTLKDQKEEFEDTKGVIRIVNRRKQTTKWPNEKDKQRSTKHETENIVVPDYDSNMMNQCLRNFQLWIEPAEHHSQRPYSYLHNIDQQYWKVADMWSDNI